MDKLDTSIKTLEKTMGLHNEASQVEKLIHSVVVRDHHESDGTCTRTFISMADTLGVLDDNLEGRMNIGEFPEEQTSIVDAVIPMRITAQLPSAGNKCEITVAPPSHEVLLELVPLISDTLGTYTVDLTDLNDAVCNLVNRTYLYLKRHLRESNDRYRLQANAYPNITGAPFQIVGITWENGDNYGELKWLTLLERRGSPLPITYTMGGNGRIHPEIPVMNFIGVPISVMVTKTLNTSVYSVAIYVKKFASPETLPGHDFTKKPVYLIEDVHPLSVNDIVTKSIHKLMTDGRDDGENDSNQNDGC